MRIPKVITLILFFTLHSSLFTQAQKVSVLGDSYSTFEGCMSNDTSAIWYFKPESPYRNKNNDVTKVEETWWRQLIGSNKSYSLEVNNSFSGATICYSGYKKGNEPRVPIAGLQDYRDYSNRSFVNRTNTRGTPDTILICGGTNASWAGPPIRA